MHFGKQNDCGSLSHLVDQVVQLYSSQLSDQLLQSLTIRMVGLYYVHGALLVLVRDTQYFCVQLGRFVVRETSAMGHHINFNRTVVPSIGIEISRSGGSLDEHILPESLEVQCASDHHDRVGPERGGEDLRDLSMSIFVDPRVDTLRCSTGLMGKVQSFHVALIPFVCPLDVVRVKVVTVFQK